MTSLNSGVLIYPGGKEELPPYENLHYPCVVDFVSALLAGTEPHSSGATALATAWVMDEAIRGSSGGKSNAILRVPCLCLLICGIDPANTLPHSLSR